MCFTVNKHRSPRIKLSLPQRTFSETSLTAFSSGVRIFLLAKGFLSLLSPIFLCHKIKDGGYNNRLRGARRGGSLPRLQTSSAGTFWLQMYVVRQLFVTPMLLLKSLYVVCSNSSVRARTFLCAKSKVRCFGGGESWVAGFIIEIVTINNMTLLPFFPRGTLNKV